MVKRIVVIATCSLLASKGFSQMVVTDLNADAQLAKLNLNVGAQRKLQVEAITKYVEQIQKAKQYIHVGKEAMKQAKQTADIMTAIMNENYSVEGFTDLNLNKNFKHVLEDILCINFDDYTPNNSTLLKIHVRFMTGIGRCNNMGYFVNTYSGMSFKSKANHYGYVRGQLNYQDYLGQIKRINQDMKQANSYEDYANNMNDRTKLEVGYKMLAVADEMIKSAEELQKILNISKSEISNVEIEKYRQKTENINNLGNTLDNLVSSISGLNGGGNVSNTSGTNQVEDLGSGFESSFAKNQKNNEGSKGIDMSRAQRIELILKSHDYLQKGLEYKQKAIELIQECSTSKVAKASIKKRKRALDKAQLEYLLYGNNNKKS